MRYTPINESAPRKQKAEEQRSRKQRASKYLGGKIRGGREIAKKTSVGL